MNPALGWNMERGIVRKPRFLQITSAPIKVQKSDYRVIAWQIKKNQDEPCPGVEYKDDSKKTKIFTLNKSSYQSAKLSYRVIELQIHQKMGMNPALWWSIRGIVRKTRFLN